ncbi:hypothetical protein MMC30_004382 [Trapelia coarctata]|nr:hypothetical protein [Trapelia coarctata]
MPGIVHKLVVIAAVEGLVLQPSVLRNQRPASSIQISYKTNRIVSLDESQPEINRNSPSLEAHGIVGLFTVASSSYLISISSRKQVAQIRGHPIFVVTGVALIPLSSQADAKKVIEQSKSNLKKRANATSTGVLSDSDTSDEEDEHSEHGYTSGAEHDDPTVSLTPEQKDSQAADSEGSGQKSSSIVQDVIGRKGQYGRFAERWFSKKGWSVERRRTLGLSANDVGEAGATDPQIPDGAGKVEDQSSPANTEKQEQVDLAKTAQPGSSTVADSLIPKLLKTAKLLFSSNSFYFSYEYDITRRLGTNDAKGNAMPLHKSLDPLFFWNRHLGSPFLDAGQHAFIVPLMQGFIGQRAFTVNTESSDPERAVTAVKESVGEVIELQNNASDAKDFRASPKTRDFLITLISRRSVLRPGLRYLRRGVDHDGNTANTVETEQILSDPSWTASGNVHSFTQIRGSIPLYFSQSPYSFKPVPVLQHSYETNHAAFKRHFTSLVDRYGGIQIALLVDKQGGEAKIGEEYEKHTAELNKENGINGTKLGFEWFDFHNICRGMKFENVSILMESLGSKLDEFGTTVENGGKFNSNQSGILRTNCMDCLDRTNVVQSACGQRALEQQLKSEGVTLDLKTDLTTQWFNTLWADNGDAISKQYSSTAALKGDYTRTRKRDYRGAINDFGLTLSRYFNNIVNDYFSQAAIDFLVGTVTDRVFSEFESDMMSADPAMSMRKLRQNAIDTSSRIVIADQSEELVGGWTLLCPREPNTLRTFPFEEVVLLVTNAAIYAVRFDWNMEKVAGFERIDIRSVVGIRKGVYVTSTLAAAQTDEERNVGFVVRYRPGERNVARVNTRSLSTVVTETDLGGESGRKEGEEEGKEEEEEAEMKKEKGSAECDLDGASSQHKIESTELKILAFKAPVSKAVAARKNSDGSEGPEPSEKEMVRIVCEEIGRILGSQRKLGAQNDEGAGMIEEGDIISLDEARRSTGLLEQLGHSLKKLVWA